MSYHLASFELSLLHLGDARDLKAPAETDPLEQLEFMHPFSILTLGIFVAGYITARWDLVTRLYELAIFAWDHGVVVCPSRDILLAPGFG